MIIKRITVKNFGSVEYYDAVLTPQINILDTLFAEEILTAIELVLCSKSLSERTICGLRHNTLIRAEVLADEGVYYVEIKQGVTDSLKLTALDEKGNDITESHRILMSHCIEQDSIDNFDGWDSSFPLRLYWYRDCDDCDATKQLHSRTNYVVTTRTFRSYLKQYIKEFKPEPINNTGNYRVAINSQGEFVVVYPDESEETPLSDTEKTLFWYICFLNIAEFWSDIEYIRNMHHEKKPLLIKNFLEFLDQTTDLDRLIARTVKLERQVIILTTPI